MTQPQPLFRPSHFLLLLLIVFCITTGAFFFLQTEPVFPDPDSLYHIKVAQLIAERGVVDPFPWLAFTGFDSYFTDQHFLYHVALVPFVTSFNSFFGAKFATVLINALLFTLFAAFLIRFRVRLWPVFLVVVFVTNPFLFRINLVKAPGVSIILLLIGLWLLFRHKSWPLVLLAFVYTWTYGGFVLLGVVALVYCCIAAWRDWHSRQALWSFFRRVTPSRFRMRAFFRSAYTHMAAATLGGLLIGVLLHPYFPKNLFFYWQQLVQIGIVNFQNVVNVGGEWHPYAFVDLLTNTVFVTIALLIALIVFVVHYRRQSSQSWTLFFLTIFFFLITLKSRRYVELYVPFATLFSAIAIRDGLPRETFTTLWQRFRGALGSRTVLTSLLAIYIVVVGVAVIAKDWRQLNSDLKSGFSQTYLADASAWLENNTPEQSIVVHSDWDEFPILFYHNTHNRYIVGLDPTFMYQYDQVLYRRWSELTQGSRGAEAESIITQDLHSAYVLVTKDHRAFQRTMNNSAAFDVVYEDNDAWIYELTDSAWSIE